MSIGERRRKKIREQTDEGVRLRWREKEKGSREVIRETRRKNKRRKKILETEQDKEDLGK